MLVRIAATLFFLVITRSSLANDWFDKADALYQAKEYSQAISFYRKSAHRGDPKGQYNLAKMYHNGLGVTESKEQAFHWYLKAAELGHTEAQYKIAIAYIFGRTTPYLLDLNVDTIKGLNWLNRAVEKGHIQAQSKLISLYSDNYNGIKRNDDKVVELMLKFANEGNVEVQKKLASYYERGYLFEKNLDMSAFWYIKAAEKLEGTQLGNVANGLKKIGYHADALRLLKKSAEQGVKWAYNDIGEIYAEGKGTTIDLVQALHWYQKGSDAGDKKSSIRLGELYEKGMGVEQDYKKAIHLYQKASSYNEAKFRLGRMYERGYGVEQDFHQALSLYKASGYKYKEQYESLNEKLNCPNAIVKLFGLGLNCVKRDEFMEAVKQAGASPKREDHSYYADIYDSSNILDGTSELVIHYFEGKFAKATYMFSINLDRNNISKMHDILVSKYGNTSKSNGKLSVGSVKHVWKLEDGIMIELSRERSNTASLLTYINPQVNYLMIKEQKKQKREREAKKIESQSNAF